MKGPEQKKKFFFAKIFLIIIIKGNAFLLSSILHRILFTELIDIMKI